MLACRRTSVFAVRTLARQCSAVEASRWTAELTVNKRCSSSLPDDAVLAGTVVGMPALSPTMTHGNIGAWRKKEGDEIAAGDVVCEVETDKATVDFDAQDDSFMAKILVEAGTQDIPVGTPIFVTVEDAASVSAFEDFEMPEIEFAAPAPEARPAAKAVTPEPVAEKKEVTAVPAPAPKAAPAPAPDVAAPVEKLPAPVSAAGTTAGLVFKRDWGSGVRGSALAHRMSTEQKKYIERFGSTLQQPLDP